MDIYPMQGRPDDPAEIGIDLSIEEAECLSSFIEFWSSRSGPLVADGSMAAEELDVARSVMTGINDSVA